MTVSLTSMRHFILLIFTAVLMQEENINYTLIYN